MIKMHYIGIIFLDLDTVTTIDMYVSDDVSDWE